MSSSSSSDLVQIRTPGAEVRRRDFLSAMGFSMGAAVSAAACRAPVQRAVPMPEASDRLVPGVAAHYATTCGGCPSSCGLVVKQRDGRPIKVEGNEQSPLFGGGACAVGQATVLSLYDDTRLRGPLWQGKPAPWSEIDQRVRAALAGGAPGDDRKVVLLSGTITSPSLRATIAAWHERHPRFAHVTWEPIPAGAQRQANRRCFGRAVLPHHRFDRARVIVALDADFLATWLSPVEFARQWAQARAATAGHPRPFHAQIESGVSLTGTSADLRLAVAPSEVGLVAASLLAAIAERAGVGGVTGVPHPFDEAPLARIADELWRHRSQSLVVSGSHDVAVQMVVSALNALLDNVGHTLDLDRPSLQHQGDDVAMAALMDDMARGEVRALILHGVNPGHAHPQGGRFVEALAKVPLTVSTADRLDETSAQVLAVCPDHHFLESWGDAEPVEGYLALAQPLIAPLGDTRAAADSLRRWLGEDADHLRDLRDHWRRDLFPLQAQETDFDVFWDRAVERGFVELPVRRPAQGQPRLQGDWRGAIRAVVAEHRRAQERRAWTPYELHLHESVPLRDGRNANNPWLLELPDPISKTTWGNFAALAPETARALGVESGDVIQIQAVGAGDIPLELPAVVQPGQDRRTVSVALGWGRARAGKAASGVGRNVYPLIAFGPAGQRRHHTAAQVRATGRRAPLAASQTHHAMEGRPLALAVSAAELAGAAEAAAALPTLWAAHPKRAPQWGMAIDLDACTGCSACVIACQAENNVPVVGRDQVQRNRLMHWIRIDRYWGDGAHAAATVHQPMMCQHCAHAPCETVCPVLATSHSAEGLNQQVYNRCIGTRYCANNCPYKVRRFNWYNYTENQRYDFHMTSPVGRLVLNPDVTVRSRGVMEKCTLCVQRIQLGKNAALLRGQPVADGEIQTACQQTCPTSAIVFGDTSDPSSRVAKLLGDRRAYRVLEELGTRPGVGYLKKVTGVRPA